VVIQARSGSAGAACPACGAWSSRVHSGYARQLADGPAGGRPVLICLAVRRFLCGNPACPAVTFAEQVTGLSARYKRRSVPLLALLAQIGLALAGRAGARLAAVLGIAVHRTTLLGLVAALPEPCVGAAPEVTGVDGFALRRVRRYGTLLADVETRRPVDILPERSADSFAAWLAGRPGTEVICRDRAGVYSDGGTRGAPGAVQVANCWHLWHNLGEAVERAAARHRKYLAAAVSVHPAAAPDEAAIVDTATPAARGGGIAERTRRRHAEVHRLLAADRSLAAIAAELGLSRNTVRRFACAIGLGELLVRDWTPRSAGILHSYEPSLRERWNSGCPTRRCCGRRSAPEATRAATLASATTSRVSAETPS